MGVVNTKATAITNADASPPVLNDFPPVRGPLNISIGTVETAADDSDNSVYRMVRLPSNAVIHSIMLFNDDLDTDVTPAIVADLGVYQTAANGAAVVDRDILATLIDTFQGANTTGVNLRHEALDIAYENYRLWEILGLSSDPQRDYDIAFTIETVAATAAAGTITLLVLWS